MDSKDLQLWVNYEESRGLKQRNVLYNNYSKWTENQAVKWFKKVYSDGVELSDFHQFAKVGLIEAIDKFDYKLGFRFETFAQHRIRGVILNNIFKFSEKSALINRKYRDQDKILDGLILAHKNVSDNSHLFLTEIITDYAFDELISQAVTNEMSHKVSGDLYCSNEFELLSERLVQKLRFLEEPEKSVMQLHYIQDLSFTEIAKLLNLSKGRISQLHKKSLSTLRAY